MEKTGFVFIQTVPERRKERTDASLGNHFPLNFHFDPHPYFHLDLLEAKDIRFPRILLINQYLV
jgi:hypothetical protein